MGRPRREDLTGRQFGGLTVEAFSHAKKYKAGTRVYWTCLCSCGHRTVMRSDIIRKSISCGCYKGELHGMTHSREYTIWKGMKRRCLHPTYKNFKNYGGRGIDFAPEWRSFSRFLSDVGPAPSSKHTLDRIDNDAGYSKRNCRWATRAEQSRNSRRNRWIEWKGKRLVVDDAARLIGVSAKTLLWRVQRWGVERAMTTPKLHE